MARYLDVLGNSFWLPDPANVASLASDFGAIRDNLATTEGELQALRSPGSSAGWTGPAADAFARCLGQLPGQLGQAHESYATVAAALSSYAAGLYPVVSALLVLAREAEEAESTLRATAEGLSYARSAGEHAAIPAWEARVRAATSNVEWLASRLRSLLSELDGLSARCAQQIRQAGSDSIHSDAYAELKRLGIITEKILLDGGDKVAHGAEDVYKVLIVKPADAVVKAIEDPSWENVGAALGDIAETVGTVVMVAALFTPIGAPVALAMFSLSALAFGCDLTAEIKHEKGASWAQAGLAGLGVVLAGGGVVSGVLGAGVNADDHLLQDAVDDSDLSQLRNVANGADPAASASSLWDFGVKNYFSPDDVADQSGGPLTELKENVNSIFHLGEDGYTHSPAAVTFQRAQWALDNVDRANHGYGLARDSIKAGAKSP